MCEGCVCERECVCEGWVCEQRSYIVYSAFLWIQVRMARVN